MSTPNPAPSPALIDEYGELQRQVDAFAPTVGRAKRLKDEIAACYADCDHSASYTAQGEIYTIQQIGPRAQQRTITERGMQKLYRTLGKLKFLEWCTFKLTDLDRLTADQGGITTVDRTGPRSIKAVAIEALGKAA